MKTTFGGARFAGGLRAPLGGAARLLIALGVAAIVATVPAVAGTLTLTWTRIWNDGGSFSGTFTVTYNDLTGAPTALVSADIITGNGTNGDGFAGQTYLYNVPGYADTVSSSGFDAIQASGSPANELTLSETGGFYYMYLDWQGTSPTTLWVGSAGGQYSSEGFKASGPGGLWSAVRYLNSEEDPGIAQIYLRLFSVRNLPPETLGQLVRQAECRLSRVGYLRDFRRY